MNKLQEMIRSRPLGKRCIIWKKTHTCKSTAGLRRYIEQYLDETQKSTPPANPSVRGKPSSLRSGIDYLTKKEKGDIHIFGFLRHQVETETSKLAHELSNAEKADAAETVWKRRLKEKGLKKVAHKIVIALDPEICEMMTLARLPVDEELLRIVQTGFEEYRQKFYSGHQIGYLLGIHHDRKHIHAHIMLYPQTDRGKPLNVSHDSKVTLENGATVCVDYQGFLKRSVERLAKDLYEKKIKNPLISYDLPIEYRSHPRVLTWDALGKTSQSKPDYSAARQIRSMQDRSRNCAKVAEELTAALDRRLEIFESIPSSEAPARLEQAKKKQRLVRAEIARQAHLARRSTKIDLFRELKDQLYKDVFRVRKVLCGSRRLVWSVPAFTESADGRWYLQRMKQGDRLGRFMNQAFENIQEAYEKSETVKIMRQIRELTSPAKKSPFVPDFFPAFWRKKRAVCDEQLAGLRQVQKARLAQIEEELTALKEKKRENLERLQACKLQMEELDLDVADMAAKCQGRLPLYLLKHKGDRLLKKSPVPCLTGIGNEETVSSPSGDTTEFPITSVANGEVLPDQQMQTVRQELGFVESPKPAMLATPIPATLTPDVDRLRKILSGNIGAIREATGPAASTPVGTIRPVETEEEIASLDI